MKIFKGVLLSAFLTYLISLLIFLIAGIGNDLILPVLFSVAIFSPIIIIGAIVIWGIPCHLLLNKFKCSNPFLYALAGIVPVPVFLAIFSPLGEEKLTEFLIQCFFFGFIGVVSAISLWYSLVYKKL